MSDIDLPGVPDAFLQSEWPRCKDVFASLKCVPNSSVDVKCLDVHVDKLDVEILPGTISYLRNVLTLILTPYEGLDEVSLAS